VKYLGIRILAGNVQKVDITDAKRKYYGCFNSILSVCGKSRNEVVSLHLVNSYCLPRLLHGCEGMLLSTLQTHELDVIWNNAFRYIFNCCWREWVKPLQFYCNTVPLSYMIDERKLQFYRKILLSKNVILRTLMCIYLVYFRITCFYAVSMVLGYFNQRQYKRCSDTRVCGISGCIFTFRVSRRRREMYEGS